MPSASATKASDKAQACRKLTSLLQKDYGKSVPRLKLPVLETMMFAVCLEDNPWDKAEAGYERLLKSYFDLNEIRVSSVSELERTLGDLRNAEWKGLRIRSVLRFVFESTYSYDFEKLAKLTLESAQKRLKKIDYLSPFVTAFTLQQVLGSHIICLDEACHRAAIHLGIVPPECRIDEASEFLKSGVKKADTFAFSHLLRCLATDPRFTDRFSDEYHQDGEFDVLKVAERLLVIKSPKKKPKKPAVSKSAAKTTARTNTKTAAKPASAGKKSAGGKPARAKKSEKNAAGGEGTSRKTASTSRKKTPSPAPRKKPGTAGRKATTTKSSKTKAVKKKK